MNRIGLGLGFHPEEQMRMREAVSGNLRTFDSSVVSALVKKNSFREILTNQDLFWILFCQTVATSNPYNGANNDLFRVSRSDSLIKIFGKEHIAKGINTFLGSIRELVLESFDRKEDVELCLVNFALCSHLRRVDAVVDYKDWLLDSAASKKILPHQYDEYICPYLSLLMDNLGAKCSQTERVVNYISNHGREETGKGRIISIQWKSDCHFVYPIPRQEVPKMSDLASSTYELYQKQILCDMTFTTNDWQEIEVHSLVFFQRGGEMSRLLLSSAMKDAKDKTVPLDHTKQVVLAYVDFVYLGEDSLKEKVYNKKLDLESLINLFKLAHYLDCQPLQLATANFITLVANPKDSCQMEGVKNLVDLYRDEHLNQFYTKCSALPLPTSSRL